MNTSITLQTAKEQHTLHVQRVLPSSSAPEQSRQLEEMGFLVGEAVEVLSKSAWGADRMVVRVGGSTFALRASEAGQIVVERVAGDASHG